MMECCWQVVVFALAFVGTVLLGVRSATGKGNLELDPRNDGNGARHNRHKLDIAFRKRVCNGKRKWRSFHRAIPFLAITLFSAIIFIAPRWLSLFSISPSEDRSSGQATKGGLMNVFQVYQEPADPLPSSRCRHEVLLMDHVFAFSFGKPFIGPYQPPEGCQFNSVTMTLTVTSRGRQFDRLALMFLGNIEVFRTSTAEPTANGIIWIYKKDMTPYLSLWRKPQKIIFDLGNLVNDVYTGTFNATLTATFSEAVEPPETPDVILPISGQRSDSGAPSAFSLPFDNATVARSIPPGTSRALVSISACGQATEEFWYSHVFSKDVDTFLNTTGPLYGFSPFREVQLLIDGHLAGVIWPFPVIFTGGIAPGFWRPVVGIDAFDLRESEIDITPWIPFLSDGKEHQFQIRVVGLAMDGRGLRLSTEVGDYWVVTGKILVFLDDEESISDDLYTSDVPSIFAPQPVIEVMSKLVQSTNGTNETLSYTVRVSRSVVITSEAGSLIQNLEFHSQNVLTAKGLSQSTEQHTKANIATLNFRDPPRSFSVLALYPLSVNTTIGAFGDSPGFSIDAALSRGLMIDSTGRQDLSFFTLTPGESKLNTSQSGTAHYSSQPNNSFSFGDTTQDFLESSRQGISIVHVEASNGSVALDAGCVGKMMQNQETRQSRRSPRAMLGRGPGNP